MSMVVEQASGAGSVIGRYFNVVSSLPSLLFVGYLYLLVRSGAWNGPVDFSDIFEGDWWKGALLLGLLAFAAALALHPLQFRLIQLLEGYWGTATLGRDLAVLRVRRQRGRLLALQNMIADQNDMVTTAEKAGEGPDTDTASVSTLAAAVGKSGGAAGADRLPTVPGAVAAHETWQCAAYPRGPGRTCLRSRSDQDFS
jgi:hypothetical protein